MSNDREVLKQIKARPVAKQTGVGALPRSIHRTPGLREWVTLESFALPPVPVKRGQTWQLVSLLIVEQKLDDGTQEWLAPWGAIEWSWPDRTVTQKIDLRKHPELDALRQPSKIKAQPADRQVTLDPRSRTLRENALFRALDDLVSNGTETPNFSSLAGYYAGLLPPEIYPYYHTLIPESREWLRSDVPAEGLTLTLPTSVATDLNNSEKTDPLPNPATVLVEPSPQIDVEQSSSQYDLSDLIETWLGQSWQITNCFKDIKTKNELIKSLKAIEQRATLPGFRLAFVGEFNRGKSSLINRLLERDLLPVGTLPTTATLTCIVAGATDQMEVALTKERKELRSLEESSWNDLLATDSAGSDQEVFTGAYITLNHDWLRELDVELIDTPGANDLDSRRATLVFDLLNQCDATVLIVRADAPMSMTEISFLEEEVIGRHVPQIIVAVSHLDRIVADGRSQLMDVIRRRVHQIEASIAVLPAYPVENETTEAECLSLLRSQIAAMVAKGDRRLWRNRQIAGQLTTYLSQIVQIGEQAVVAVHKSEAEHQQALQKAQKQLQKADLDWDILQNELERRRIECDQALRQKLQNTKTDLMELLLLELSKTPNPKLWWERDLPWRLRRELTALSRKSEEFVMAKIAQDFDWLQTENYRLFGILISEKVKQNLEKYQINAEIPDVEINNIQQYRLLTRLGTTTAMICSYLLPIVSTVTGLIISTTGGFMSEQFLDKKLEEQRQILSQILNQVVDRAINQYSTQVSQRLRKLYHQFSTDVKQEQAQWVSTKKIMIEIHQQTDDETTWQQVINQASALKSQILTALSQ